VRCIAQSFSERKALDFEKSAMKRGVRRVEIYNKNRPAFLASKKVLPALSVK